MSPPSGARRFWQPGLTSGPLTWLLAAVEQESAPTQGQEKVKGAGRRLAVRTRSAVLVVGALLSLAAVAAAAGEAQRDKAAQAVASVKADEKAAAVAREPIAKAEKALERGADARKTGDTVHADQLDALALEWAETGVDMARTGELENRASLIEKETAELEARAKRALSLIEQTVARRGRARERLRELGVDPERTPESTATPAPQPAPAQQGEAPKTDAAPKKDGAK